MEGAILRDGYGNLTPDGEFNALISKWNDHFEEARDIFAEDIAQDSDLDDLDDEVWENFIVDELFKVCGTKELALAVWNDSRNDAGWSPSINDKINAYTERAPHF